MPRELVHWYVVETVKAREACRELTGVNACLTQFQPFVQLGAIAHDAPYYLHFGRDAEFTALGERLHGRDGEDTLEVIHTLARSIAVPNRDERRGHAPDQGVTDFGDRYLSPPHPRFAREPLKGALEQSSSTFQIIPDISNEDSSSIPGQHRTPHWAFLIGLLSHCVTDWVMHPAIIYLTGNYYHPDINRRRENRANHRLLEVYLDSLVAHKLPGELPHKIRELLKECEAQLPGVLETLCSYIAKGDASIASRWRQSLDHTASCQRLFFSPIVGFVVRALSALLPNQLAQYDALFSLGRQRIEPKLEARFEYRHPLTGIQQSTTWIELCDQAADELIELLRVVEVCITANESKQLESLTGKCLSTGIQGAKVEECRFFLEQEACP